MVTPLRRIVYPQTPGTPHFAISLGYVAHPLGLVAEALLGLIRHCRRDRRRLNQVWCGCIDADTFANNLVTESAYEGDYSTFGGCVVQ